MNNYCTNCGEKLETNADKTNQCNTYVDDIKLNHFNIRNNYNYYLL